MLVKKISHVERKTGSRSSGKRDTFIAMLHDADRHRDIPVYYKVFPILVSGKCSFNEFLGSYLLKYLGIDTPDLHMACCEPALLEKYKNNLCRKLGNDLVGGVASESALPRGVIQIRRDSPLFWAQLMNWQGIAFLAAADELMGNTDRTAFNILQAGHRFIPIDHDQCLGGEVQTADGLRKALTGPTFKNLLAEEIGKCTDEKMKIRMIQAAQNIISRYKFDNINFHFDTDVFFQLEPGTTHLILQLIEARKNNLAEYMNAYIQMGKFLQTSA